MKTYILLLTGIVTCTISCKKETRETSPYYIRMTINGSEKLFSANAYAAEYSGDLTAGFSMQANNDSAQTAFSLGIIHPFGVTLAEGEYNNTSAPYIPGSGYSKAGVFTYYGGHEGASTINVIVSHLTGKTVSGTFSGWYFNSTNAQDSIYAGNGNFYLPVRQ